MKKNLLSLLLLGGLGGALSTQSYAQGYEPLLVSSGFTADVIANGTGTAVSKTSAAVDDASAPGAGYAYVARNYLLTGTSLPLTYGLPTNGILGSAVAANSGMQFRLNDYDLNNSLRLANTNDAGTLTFSNTLAAKKLFIAGTTGSGSATVTVRITFTDASFEDVTGLTIADWYGGSNAIIQGIGRINRADNGLDAAGGTNPRIYQIAVDISAANQSKLVQSITVTKTSTTTGIVNVFGATADLSGLTCDMPTALSAATSSPTAASVSWTAAAGASSYEYYYSTSNIMPAMSFTGTVASGTTATLSGLNTSTTYYVWVRSVCGAGNKSAWTATTNFTTPLVTGTPWLEAFFNTAAPTGFTTTNWTIGSARGVTGNPGNNIYRRFSNATAYNFSTISVGTIQTGDIFTFDYKHANYASPYGAPAAGAGYFKVSVSTNFGTSYTQIDSIAVDANSNWNPKSYSLNAYSGNYVKIKIDAARTAGDWDLAFDNLYIGAPITCLMPLNPTVSATTANSATVNWTAPATAPSNGYEYYYSTTNTAPTATTVPNGNTAAGIVTETINGLSPNTTYYLWMRSSCGAMDKSMWTQSAISFTTPCVAYAIPYFEGFESGYSHNSSISGCLSQASITGTSTWTINNTFTDRNRTPRTGGWNAFLQYSNEDWLFIPIQLTGGTSYTVSLYARQDGATASNSNVAISYGTINTTAGMTNSIVTATGIVNGDYQLISAAFTPATTGVFYVGIKGFMNGSPWYISLDDISIDVTPSCLVPTLLSAYSSTPSSATISWTAPVTAPANGYEYYYSTSNTAPIATTSPSGSTGAGVTTATLSTLSASTPYFVWVRSNCSATDKSAWTSAVTFTTPASCLMPTALQLNAINANSATISWTASLSTPANGYEYYYSTTNTAPTTATTPSGTVGAGVTTATIGSLPTSTTYYVWVRSNCSATDKSDWTNALSFTTLCNPTNVPYTQDFETTTGTALPSCTFAENVGTGNIWTTGSGSNGFTNRVLRYAYHSSNAANTWFYTQGINLTAGTAYEIKYAFGNNGGTTFLEKLKVAYGTAVNAAAMTTTLGDHPNINHDKKDTAVIFTPATTGVYYFGFQAYSIADRNVLMVDNINIDLAPTCFVPTMLASNTVTASTANISWTAPTTAPANGYEYYYSTTNTAPTGATIANGATAAGVTTAALSTLTANSTYYFWVRSVCTATDKSNWSAVATFYTGYCNPAPVNVDGSGIVNVSFSNVNNPTGTETNNYGNYSAMVGNVYQGQVVPVDITYQTGYAYTTKIWIDWNNDLDFTDPGEEVYSGTSTSNSPTTLNATITVPAGTALGQYRMRIGGVEGGTPTPCYTGSWASYEDYSINVTVPPTCIAPTALNTSAITSNGVTLNWTASTTTVGVGYDYYISTTSTAPTSTTTPTGSVAASATTATTTTLIPATVYYYWVRSNCAATDQSTWASGGSFTTLCAPFAVPFLQEFSGGNLPTCWTNTNIPAATDANLFWKFSGAVDYGTTNNGKTAGTFAWVDASSPYTSDVVLTSPMIDLSTVNAPFITFQWYKYHSMTATGGINTADDNNKLIVEVNDGTTTSWTQIFADTSNVAAWRTETITLPASYVGATVQFRFIVDKNTGTNPDYYDNVLLDSVYVFGAPCTSPVVALGADTTICAGATLTLNAGTSNPNATYVWANSANTTPTLDVTATGTYSVTVTDGACVAHDTIVVTVADLPVIDLGIDTAICEGETITLDATTGTTTDTYEWSDQSTNATLDVTTAGVYHVTITSALGCVASDTIEVTINPLPSADSIVVTGTSPNFTFGVANGANIDTYEWSFGDGQSSTQDNPTHVYTTSGTAQTIEVAVIISNDCGSDTLYTQVTIAPVGIKTLHLNADALKLYPNPTAHNVVLENTSNFKMKQVIITNLLGQQVAIVPVNGNKQTIDVSNLTSGLYHVKVEFEEGVVTRKLEVLK